MSNSKRLKAEVFSLADFRKSVSRTCLPPVSDGLIDRSRGKRRDPLQALRFVQATERATFDLEHAITLAASIGHAMRKDDLEILKRAVVILEREGALASPAEECA